MVKTTNQIALFVGFEIYGHQIGLTHKLVLGINYAWFPFWWELTPYWWDYYFKFNPINNSSNSAYLLNYITYEEFI